VTGMTSNDLHCSNAILLCFMRQHGPCQRSNNNPRRDLPALHIQDMPCTPSVADMLQKHKIFGRCCMA
jgi:hypothetical protein